MSSSKGVRGRDSLFFQLPQPSHICATPEGCTQRLGKKQQQASAGCNSTAPGQFDMAQPPGSEVPALSGADSCLFFLQSSVKASVAAFLLEICSSAG